jgi:hypothetical protein
MPRLREVPRAEVTDERILYFYDHLFAPDRDPAADRSDVDPVLRELARAGGGGGGARGLRRPRHRAGPDPGGLTHGRPGMSASTSAPVSPKSASRYRCSGRPGRPAPPVPPPGALSSRIAPAAAPLRASPKCP